MTIKHNARAIWHVLKAIGASDCETTAIAVGCSRNNAYAHIKKMLDAGYVIQLERIKSANDKNYKHQYAINPDADVLYAEYMKLPPEVNAARSSAMKARHSSTATHPAVKSIIDEGGVTITERGIIHRMSSTRKHGDRGAGQRNRVKSCGFSSGEMVV